MKTGCSVFFSLTVAALLTACATPASQKNTHKYDRKQQVVYDCGAGKKKQTLRAMYAFNGNQIAAVQIRLNQRETPIMPPTAQAGVFASEGVTWTTAITDAASVHHARGRSLTAAGTKKVKGRQQIVVRTLAQNCRVNRKASARANQTQ